MKKIKKIALIFAVVLCFAMCFFAVEASAETVCDENGHDYVTEVVAPTCEKRGYTISTCSVCSKSIIGDYVDALGHIDEDDNGWCDRCEQNICTHESSSIVGAVAKSCGVNGYTGDRVCDKCGIVLDQGSVIRMTSHVEAAAVKENVVNATCTTEGSYDSVVYCANCGAELSRTPVRLLTSAHHDANNDGICDDCGVDINADAQAGGRDTCLCHSTSIIGKIVWALLKIVYKLVGINQYCECGIAHY